MRECCRRHTRHYLCLQVPRPGVKPDLDARQNVQEDACRGNFEADTGERTPGRARNVRSRRHDVLLLVTTSLWLAALQLGACTQAKAGTGETFHVSNDLTLQEYEEVLREASSVGDVATVAKLVEKRYVKDVDAPNGLGWTALHLAAYGGHLEVVEQLLHAGASVTQKDLEGHSVLHFAASCRKEFCTPRVHIMKRILGVGDSQSSAKQKGRRSASAGDFQKDDEGEVNERMRSPGSAWSNANNRALIMELMTTVDKRGMTALHVAVSRGHAALVKEMLELFSDDDDPSYEPKEESITYNLLHKETSNGYTALHLAAAQKDRKTTQLLLDAGANPTKTCKVGKTALELLAEYGEDANDVRGLLKEAEDAQRRGNKPRQHDIVQVGMHVSDLGIMVSADENIAGDMYTNLKTNV